MSKTNHRRRRQGAKRDTRSTRTATSRNRSEARAKSARKRKRSRMVRRGAKYGWKSNFPGGKISNGARGPNHVPPEIELDE